MEIKLDKISINSEDDFVEVKINDDIKIPSKLYKYYTLSPRSVDSVRNSTIHFGHSFTMNDLMDGNFLLWDIESFLTTFMFEKGYPTNEKDYYRKLLVTRLSDDFLKYVGCFCLCENFNNDLLWSHYTNEKGFCIEFNTNSLLNNFEEYQNYFFPINYSDLKQINFEKYSERSDNGRNVTMDSNIPLFYCLANKEEFWSYEKEWRLVVRNEKFTSISNPQSIITSEEKRSEKELSKSRNLKISKTSINKIILSTLFFKFM